MDMTHKKETNGFLRSLILALISAILGAAVSILILAYSYGGYVAQIKSSCVRIEKLENIVLSGRDARIDLQAQVKNLTNAMESMKLENKEAHTEIKESIQRLYEMKRLSMVNKDQNLVP